MEVMVRDLVYNYLQRHGELSVEELVELLRRNHDLKPENSLGFYVISALNSLDNQGKAEPVQDNGIEKWRLKK